ncbi:MAG: hypothetical protein AN483_07035 [Aphanizomenon flos-aquae MDT14a]|jgi:hypothetical protein|nr:MAG: hypothetical protein AN483_07035 [Aphanizomenon flos-aquae MDT14a]
MKVFIGVDPGSKGAIVAINENKELIICADMPFVDGQISMRGVAKIFSDFDPNNSFAAIEVAKAMSQKDEKKGGEKRSQSVASMLKYGRGLGALQMCIFMKQISCTEVQSVQWMSLLGVNGKTSGQYNGDKVAVELIPQIKDLVYEKNSKYKNGVKICDGRADAALIAEWKLRKYLSARNTKI